MDNYSRQSQDPRRFKAEFETLSQSEKLNLKSYINNTKLFHQIPSAKITTLFNLLRAEFRSVKKGTYLYKCCESAEELTILISGILYGIQFDDAGNRSIVQAYRPLEVLGLPLAFGFDALHMNIIASDDTIIISFPYENLRHLIGSDDIHARQLFWNISEIQSDSSVAMKTRISILSKRNTREKILYYLKKEAQYHNSLHFKIPFSRQDLADYLFVERTALSHQLSRLKKDGYLNYIQNEFDLNPSFFVLNHLPCIF